MKNLPKENVVVMHLTDGSTVMGKVVERKKGSLLVEDPLSVKVYNSLESFMMIKYNVFNSSKGFKVKFNTKNVVSEYEPDDAVKNFYENYTETSSETEFRSTLGDPKLAKSSDELNSKDGFPSLEELRKTTKRLND